MLITTLHSVENHIIKKDLGIVISIATETVKAKIISRDFNKDPDELINLKNILLTKVESQAKAMGANAVINLDIETDYQAVSSLLIIRLTAAGTAVVLEESV